MEILEFYDVAERLGQLATLLHPDDPEPARRWRQERKTELLAGGPGPLLRWLRQWQSTTAPAQEVRRVQLG